MMNNKQAFVHTAHHTQGFSQRVTGRYPKTTLVVVVSPGMRLNNPSKVVTRYW